ncbi:DoxX family protein [Sinomicrobium oceani]|uniref:DoxX family protein n=1 Tax=Sinomicrobium oceani TaxID=1150368 RepID=UPI00227AE8D3|nr:DoxX family protein [Sinomicrobium oceani]
MKLFKSHKQYIVTVICLLYVLLFIYAAVSKLLDFENFRVQLGQSPMLSVYAGWIAWVIPSAEILIAALLLFYRTRLLGLLASFGLMVMFTTYIYITLNYSSFIPCSCGGILEKLGWTEHLVFNLFFVLIALVGISLLIHSYKGKQGSTLFLWVGISSLTVCSIGIVILLFISSEDRIYHENPFIRRYPHHPVKRTHERDLTYNSYYIAGTWKDKIYLGNATAPLHLLSIDTTLKDTQYIRLKLDRKDLPFRSVKTKVYPPYFFLMDGTVPCIFRGKISDGKASPWMYNNAYFSIGEPIDSNAIAIRARSSRTKENVLGIIRKEGHVKVALSEKLLQKQIDGVFDTDGQLLWNPSLKQMIYMHYYRNEIIVADSQLQLIRRNRTIDTISQAQIKIAEVNSKHMTKMAGSPLKVNNHSRTYGDFLFVHSNLLGKYESENMWRKTSVIDVYNLPQNSYVFSFYIHDKNGKKIKDFMVSHDLLIVLQDHYILTYRLRSKYTGNTGSGSRKDTLANVRK